MKKLVLLCLIATTALAGERYIGIIYTSTSKSNASASPDGGTAWLVEDALTQPFVIPSRALVSLQCNADMYVATDSTTATALNGVYVPTNTLFPTSVGANKATLSTDAGVKTPTAVISILPTYNDGGYLYCRVFERMGNE